jgi:hypothetical protein
MAQFHVNYRGVADGDSAFAAVKALLSSSFLRQFPIEIELFTPPGHSRAIGARGKGVEIVLSFEEFEVVGKTNFSMMLKPFESKIIDQLKAKLTQVV